MVPSGVDPLAAWLQEQLGIQLVDRSAVGGGCIHRAWCLQSKRDGRLFAKTNRADQLPLLKAEAEGLHALAKVAPPGLVIPTPLALGLAGKEAVLVLPWLELSRGNGRPGAWAECGADLARLHRNSLLAEGLANPPQVDPAQAFGWGADNFIGAFPQRNGWHASWSSFFAECRLRPQLQALGRKGLAMAGSNDLLQRLPEWLEGHPAQPCLVHGDLWSGNAALVAGGGASVFDPAIYRGDRETDLAMARLFGGFPESFFHGYQEEWPLAEGGQIRKKIYQLYHLLNHANLFGGAYIQQAQTLLTALLGL